MNIKRLWLDQRAAVNLVKTSFGVGDLVNIDGDHCLITSIIGIENVGAFAGKDIFSVALEVPSGTRERKLHINANHVISVEFEGD
jgi:hypothetical protein